MSVMICLTLLLSASLRSSSVLCSDAATYEAGIPSSHSYGYGEVDGLLAVWLVLVHEGVLL